MHPFNDYRKSYITVCFATAVIYAFALKGDLPVVPCLADTVLYGGLLSLSGFVLWNTFKFAIPAANYTLGYQLIFIAALIIPAGLLITGIETLVLYLLFPSRFGSFIYTIPARLFITLLIFIIIRLFYTTTQHTTASSGKRAIPPAVAVLPIDRITIRTGQKIKIIPVKDIIYIKADGDYISVCTSEGSWLKEQTMKHTEDILPADRFVRIHRSYIVNINHISRIERYGEKQQVILHNNEKIKISAARYQTLRQIIGF